MRINVVLEYEGTQYRFIEEASYPNEEVAIFWWDDGNGSCDCNRSGAIQRYCDPNFPKLDCGGELIDLIAVEVISL